MSYSGNALPTSRTINPWRSSTHIRFHGDRAGAGDGGGGLFYVASIDSARRACSVVSNSTIRRVGRQLLPVNDQSASSYERYCTPLYVHHVDHVMRTPCVLLIAGFKLARSTLAFTTDQDCEAREKMNFITGNMFGRVCSCACHACLCFLYSCSNF